jgi:hypothetical protein
MEIDLFKVCPKLLGKIPFTQVDDEEADNTNDCLLLSHLLGGPRGMFR